MMHPDYSAQIHVIHARAGAQAEFICNGCRTLLSYPQGATKIQCVLCGVITTIIPANKVANVNCGGCGTMLEYSYGAHRVKCSVCQYVTRIDKSVVTRMPLPTYGPPMQASSFESQPSSWPQIHTVIVENPMTLDESGKLVTNVAVGLTGEKK